MEYTEDCETTARIAVGAVELVAPYEVWWSTHVVLTRMRHDAAPADKTWDRMVQQMRDDLGARGPWRPIPEPEATSS